MKIIILYIPALHKGYIDFITKHNPQRVYLIDLELIREIPRLERDIRAIDSDTMTKALKEIINADVFVLNKDNISEIHSLMEIIMPDEDVSREFYKNYLNSFNVSFYVNFLRWDKHSSLKENSIVPNRIISRDEFDKEIMSKALIEGQKSPDWWRQVGAVVLKDKKILFKGFNRPLPSDQVHNIFGDPRSNFDYGISYDISKFIHAEAGIIAEAAKKGISLEGTDFYITTFPCPSCAKLIAISGVSKVYYSEGYSLLDAEDILKSFNIEIVKVEN